MAGNYDSMVFGPGNGDTVSAAKSARACDSSQGCWVMTGWCPPATPPPALAARECSHADGRALESMKLHETSWIKAERKSQQHGTLCGARIALWPCMEAATGPGDCRPSTCTTSISPRAAYTVRFTVFLNPHVSLT
jgi:hypothetical protein